MARMKWMLALRPVPRNGPQPRPEGHQPSSPRGLISVAANGLDTAPPPRVTHTPVPADRGVGAQLGEDPEGRAPQGLRWSRARVWRGKQEGELRMLKVAGQTQG